MLVILRFILVGALVLPFGDGAAADKSGLRSAVPTWGKSCASRAGKPCVIASDQRLACGLPVGSVGVVDQDGQPVGGMRGGSLRVKSVDAPRRDSARLRLPGGAGPWNGIDI